jgi:hypothetical protein
MWLTLGKNQQNMALLVPHITLAETTIPPAGFGFFGTIGLLDCNSNGSGPLQKWTDSLFEWARRLIKIRKKSMPLPSFPHFPQPKFVVNIYTPFES